MFVPPVFDVGRHTGGHHPSRRNTENVSGAECGNTFMKEYSMRVHANSRTHAKMEVSVQDISS